MAYVSKEDKAKIRAELKGKIPKGWRTSLAVANHSTIVLNIWAADVDLISDFNNNNNPSWGEKHVVEDNFTINHFYIEKHFSKDVAEILIPIYEALNSDNYNNSDVYRDYHDVGHYVEINVGKWNKPFEYKAA